MELIVVVVPKIFKSPESVRFLISLKSLFVSRTVALEATPVPPVAPLSTFNCAEPIEVVPSRVKDHC